MSIASKLC